MFLMRVQMSCQMFKDADLKVSNKYSNFPYLCNECIAVEGSLKLDVLKNSVDKCMSLIAKQNESIESHSKILKKINSNNSSVVGYTILKHIWRL